MNDRPALSRGELEVARVLWQLKRASVREVHQAFPDSRQIDFTTVQTYLRRLEQKGYVKAKLEGRTRIYTSRVRPRTVIRDTVDDFVDCLFGGDSLPLMRHLIEDGELTSSDVTVLRRLLDQMEDDSDVRE